MNVPETFEEKPPAEGRATAETPSGQPRGVATMAIVRWVLVLITALVATGSILSFAGVHFGSGPSATSGQAYYCPMHPSVVQDHPGECPICSMTLVLKPGGKTTLKMATRPAASGGGNAAMAAPTVGVPGLADVDLTPERIQLIGMRTATVKREAIGGDLPTVGVVAANERGLAQINTRFGGWIQKLLVSETGQRVRRGQVLATIYSPEVFRAEQELLLARGWSSAGGDAGPSSARTELGSAQRNPPREGAGTLAGSPHSEAREDVAGSLEANARGRLELLGIAPREIDEMLRTGKAAEAIPIRSPVDGYVVGKNAVAGVAVQSGFVLFEVADLTEVWVTADIYEQDISRVRVGQRARIELASYPGEIQTGKVTFIYPVLDSGSRTLRLRLELKNKSDRNGPRLRPGMYGTVYLQLPSTTGLTVPSEAVVDTGETRYLFVSKDGGRFEPRTVEVGAHLRDEVEILSGVAEGETVVTTGNFLVDSESRLRAAIEGQTSPERR
jgi:membrane fusion protein, copper/silver efflux system